MKQHPILDTSYRRELLYGRRYESAPVSGEDFVVFLLKLGAVLFGIPFALIVLVSVLAALVDKI